MPGDLELGGGAGEYRVLAAGGTAAVGLGRLVGAGEYRFDVVGGGMVGTAAGAAWGVAYGLTRSGGTSWAMVVGGG